MMNRTNIRAACTALAGVLLSFGAMAEPWKYETLTDKMTDAQTRMAYLQSTNSLSLPPPYAGKNYGWIYVRQHPQHGQDVIVRVNKGQILCHIPECQLLFRIDDGKATQITFLPSSSHESNVALARNAKALIAQLIKAKKVMIQVPMFQAGNQVLEFEADKPLEWAAPAPAPKKASGARK